MVSRVTSEYVIRIFQLLLWADLILMATTQHGYQQRVGYAGIHESHRRNPHPISRIDHNKSEPANQRPAQRMNERYIPFTSAVQKIQEKERRRLQSRIEESIISRVENGSYKIVNYRKNNIANRRGTSQVEDFNQGTRDNMVFPGPTTKTSSRNSFIPEVPPECRKMGICEKMHDYPEDYVNEILLQLGEGRRRFRIDELEPPEIAHRIGSLQETELCQSDEKIVIPDALPHKNGKWYFILNPRTNPLQRVRVEVCRPGKESCAKIASFPLGYEAKCEQKYLYSYLSAFDENGTLIYEPFKLPSCCSCVVSEID